LLPAVFLAVLLLVPPAPARAFEDGTSGLSISLGAGKQLDRGYTVLSGRYGYYVVREFEASLAFEAWRGNDPAIYKVVPELRYVYSQAAPIKPYFGIFLARTFYDGLPDRNSFGGKTGGYLTLNRGAHLGLGVVYERIEGCNEGTYRKCRQLYPEVAVHFTF
jgi:hypothetical protein